MSLIEVTNDIVRPLLQWYLYPRRLIVLLAFVTISRLGGLVTVRFQKSLQFEIVRDQIGYNWLYIELSFLYEAVFGNNCIPFRFSGIAESFTCFAIEFINVLRFQELCTN